MCECLLSKLWSYSCKALLPSDATRSNEIKVVITVQLHFAQNVLIEYAKKQQNSSQMTLWWRSDNEVSARLIHFLICSPHWTEHHSMAARASAAIVQHSAALQMQIVQRQFLAWDLGKMCEVHAPKKLSKQPNVYLLTCFLLHLFLDASRLSEAIYLRFWCHDSYSLHLGSIFLCMLNKLANTLLRST